MHYHRLKADEEIDRKSDQAASTWKKKFVKTWIVEIGTFVDKRLWLHQNHLRLAVVLHA